MLRLLCVSLAVFFGYTATSFACQPPPSQISYEGDESLTMSPTGPLVVPFTLHNAFTDIRVLDVDGNDAGGRTRYHDLAAEWHGETFEQKMLMFWTPAEPLAPDSGYSLEWQQDFETLESKTIVVEPYSAAEIQQIEPDTLVFEELMVTESRCEPVPDDMPGMCPICDDVTVPRDFLTATFTLTGNRYIVRRIARYRDGQADSGALYLWDAGTQRVARLEFVEGCYVSQAKDLRTGTMNTSEPTCYDRTGSEIGFDEVNNLTGNNENNENNVEQNNFNNSSSNNEDFDSPPDDLDGSKADDDGCSSVGTTASPWILAILLFVWGAGRRRA